MLEDVFLRKHVNIEEQVHVWAVYCHIFNYAFRIAEFQENQSLLQPESAKSSHPVKVFLRVQMI